MNWTAYMNIGLGVFASMYVRAFDEVEMTRMTIWLYLRAKMYAIFWWFLFADQIGVELGSCHVKRVFCI